MKSSLVEGRFLHEMSVPPVPVDSAFVQIGFP